MAWNPNIPAVTNRVQDDLNAIRENFQHLDPLAQAVDDLQTVSGLAQITDDLQTVSELAPYVQALFSSRIVDHNLDVANPPNGWYIRLATGLQLCLTASHIIDTIDESIGGMIAATGQWVLPAPFSSGEYYADFSVLGTNAYWSHPTVRFWPWTTQVHAKQAAAFSTRLQLADTSLMLPPEFVLTGVMAFAIGRW